MMRLIFGLAVALIVAGAWLLPPDFDETYYWTWSRALAWSYYDHPPGIAWAIRCATGIFGDGILALRSVSLLSMAIVALFTIASVQRLVPADRRHAARQLALLSLLGAPMFALGYLPATPDSLQGAAVAIGAYLIVRGFVARAAFLLTASLLVKHSTALLLLPLLVQLPSSPGRSSARDSRSLYSDDPVIAPLSLRSRTAPRKIRWLRTFGALYLVLPRAWIGALPGALLLLPWLVSDASTGFQLDRLLTSAPRGPIAIPLTVGSMMGTLGPLTALLLVALPFLHRKERLPQRILAIGSFLLLIACVVAVWCGTGEANWPMPAMVFALPALVGFVVVRGGRLLAIALWIARGSSVLTMVALVHVVHPFLPVPPAKDRTMRSVGFDDVARAVRSTAAKTGTTKVIARRYQIASELRYHLQDELTVHELGTSRRSQYDRWPRAPLCANETAVLVLPHTGVPVELPADAIGSAIPVLRQRGARVVDTYYVTPIRLRTNVGSCR